MNCAVGGLAIILSNQRTFFGETFVIGLFQIMSKSALFIDLNLIVAKK